MTQEEFITEINKIEKSKEFLKSFLKDEDGQYHYKDLALHSEINEAINSIDEVVIKLIKKFKISNKEL